MLTALSAIYATVTTSVAHDEDKNLVQYPRGIVPEQDMRQESLHKAPLGTRVEGGTVDFPLLLRR